MSPVAAEVVVADFEVSKTRSIFEGPWEWVHLGYLLAFSGWNGSSSTLSPSPAAGKSALLRKRTASTREAHTKFHAQSRKPVKARLRMCSSVLYEIGGNPSWPRRSAPCYVRVITEHQSIENQTRAQAGR